MTASRLPSRSAPPHLPRDPGVRLFMRLGFKAKALLATSLLVLPLLALLAWQAWTEYGRDMQSRQTALQQQVQVAHKLLAWAHAQELSGALPRADAQRLAKTAVSQLRYGDGDYFWINDMTPAMVMHPIKPEMDGKDLSTYQDPNGLLLFKAMVEVARNQGSGLLAYQWPKPAKAEPQDKISYVMAFQPWGWVVGSGVYVDAVLAHAKQGWLKVGGVVALTLLVGLYAFRSFYVAMRRGLQGAIDAADAVGAGRLDYPVPLATAHNEESRLLNALQTMQDRLRDRQRDDDARSAAANAEHQAAQRTAEEINAAVQAATQGDFSHRVATAGKAEFHAALCTGFNQLVDSVSRTFAQVREATSQLGSASQQVSQTSQSMAQSASQQAAGVEETSAALQQISASVQANASSATRTDRIATEAASPSPARRPGGGADGRGDEEHRHQDLDHRRHRLPDQPAGAERCDRGGTRRRTRQGLCRGRRRGAQAGRTQPGRRPRDRPAGRQQRAAGRAGRCHARPDGAGHPPDQPAGADHRPGVG